jgi:hypothetical protein
MTFIVPGRQQKLKSAICKFTAASRFSIFREKSIVSRQNRFMNVRMVPLFRSTCEVHIDRSSIAPTDTIKYGEFTPIRVFFCSLTSV